MRSRLPIVRAATLASCAALLTMPLAFAAPAHAAEPEGAAEPLTLAPPPDSAHVDTPAPTPPWSVDVGLRASFLRGAGYDPYSTDDALRFTS